MTENLEFNGYVAGDKLIPDSEKLESPEKIETNFKKAFELFISLCKQTNYSSYDAFEQKFSKSPPILRRTLQIEGYYGTNDSIIRVRLGHPQFSGDKKIPILIDANNVRGRDLENFASLFAKNGIVVKF